jgi:membrane protein
MQNWIEHKKHQAENLFSHLDKRLWGVPGVLRDASQHFSETRGPEAAASMAYYTIFSLFPLLLSVIAISSFFFEREDIQTEILRLIRLIIPVSPGVIVNNIQEVLEERTTFGITGGVGLIWASSAVFITLFRNINRAWQRAAPINLLKSRLFAVLLIVLMVILMLLVRFGAAAINLLPLFDDFALDLRRITEEPIWIVLGTVIPLTVTFLIFTMLYKWIPNTSVHWNEALWAGLTAAIAWEITTSLFTWALSAGLAQYRLVYGSLGAMIALLFWIYINSLILIFCAHLSAAIARKKRPFEAMLD